MATTRHAFLILAIMTAVTGTAQTNAYPIGSTVENFITLDTDGNFHTLYDLTAAGKTVVLDFFFYSCEPCQQYAPAYSEFYETYGCNQGGVVCFHVNAGIDSDALAAQFADDFGGPFAHPPTIGQFNGGLLTDIFGVDAFPTLCVIAPDNTMWNDNVWPVDLPTLESNFPEGTAIKPMPCSVTTTIGDSEPGIPAARLVDHSLVLQHGGRSNGPIAVDIIDPTGRCTAHWSLNGGVAGTMCLPLPEMAGGAYVIRMSSSFGTITTKAVHAP